MFEMEPGVRNEHPMIMIERSISSCNSTEFPLENNVKRRADQWGGSPLKLNGFILIEACNLKVQHVVP